MDAVACGRRRQGVLSLESPLVKIAESVPKYPVRTAPARTIRKGRGRTALLVFGPLLAIFLPASIVNASGSAQSAVGSRTKTGPVALTSAAPPKPSHCPWVSPSLGNLLTPTQLASEVESHMTLTEKFDLVILHVHNGYENSTTAIPRLCLPSLTLQDGPNGIAFGDTGVTQLPSSIGLAATFDLQLAKRYGEVLGSEAKHQGIDVVQGPNLNIDRVPNSGRTFEGFGEDPFLVAAMGVADIDGIQSQGVMANAKHFTAYNQETDRLALDEYVSNRALEEIYLPPFKAAVQQANVASIMCAYGRINGLNACEGPSLFHMLIKSWGFTGFIRSDLTSVTDSAAAFNAGLDMIKPATPDELTDEISAGELTVSSINRAVLAVLTQMFTYHLVTHPFRGHLNTKVATSAHAQLALRVAEQSTVLLKDHNKVLPLRASTLKKIAVIGTDAAGRPATAGTGGAYVVAPFVDTPLAAITRALGPRAVSYAPGGSAAGPYPAIPSLDFSSPGNLHSRAGGKQLSGTLLRALKRQGVAGTGSFSPSLFGLLPTESTTFAPKHSGVYTFSLTSEGNSWLYFDHKVLIKEAGVDRLSTWSASVDVIAGRRYPVRLTYYAGVDTPTPRIGMQYQGDFIANAVATARTAKVAVVFVSDLSSEGDDHPTLALPGDEDALISAVAAVNHHTIVIVNSGGAVLMPWLSKVAGVIEAWYPGEQDGAAISAVLFGRIDPSGHLPITFPTSNAQSPTHAQKSWPGVNGIVHYDEGLDVGYRYYQAHGLTPLFPFGFGLSYTTFAVSGLQVTTSPTGDQATVEVKNTGQRAGTAVVQAYLGFPAAAGEPPEQLVSFGSVTLAPGASAPLSLSIGASSFLTYLGTKWQPVAGSYTLSLGQSSVDLPLSVSLQAPQLATSATTPQ